MCHLLLDLLPDSHRCSWSSCSLLTTDRRHPLCGLIADSQQPLSIDLVSLVHVYWFVMYDLKWSLLIWAMFHCNGCSLRFAFGVSRLCSLCCQITLTLHFIKLVNSRLLSQCLNPTTVVPLVQWSVFPVGFIIYYINYVTQQTYLFISLGTKSNDTKHYLVQLCSLTDWVLS